jgi:hypothetical protein
VAPVSDRPRIPNVASLRAQWWREFWWRLELSAHVRVRHPAPDLTEVEVEDSLPHLRLRGVGRARYRVTSERLFLRKDQFDANAREMVMRDARKARGRAVFCLDLRRGEVMAATSFHVDPVRSLPLQVRGIAVRTDTEGGEAMWAKSQFCVAILLAYLYVAAAKDRRPDAIGFLARGRPEIAAAEQLGFHQAPTPDQLTRPGTWMAHDRLRCPRRAWR